jgi:poly(hydroxyalkanoate) granule-associated protein
MEPEDATTQTAEKSEGENGSSNCLSPIEAAKRVALAGLGAVAVATEATDEIFQDLVKKGEQTREEAAREFRHARERTAARRADAQGYVRSRVDSVMDHMNLPSKADVDALDEKLNVVAQKLDEVQADRSGTSASAPDAPPRPSDSDLA